MNLKQLVRSEGAISPVVGVILLLAITTTLAAVVGGAVLTVGEEITQTPSASFEFEYQPHYDADYGNLTITHEGGDRIRTARVVIRGRGIKSSKKADFKGSKGSIAPSGFAITTSDTQWGSKGTATATKGGDPAVTTGDYVRVWVRNDHDIRLVYTGSDTSSTLGESVGPA